MSFGTRRWRRAGRTCLAFERASCLSSTRRLVQSYQRNGVRTRRRRPLPPLLEDTPTNLLLLLPPAITTHSTLWTPQKYLHLPSTSPNSFRQSFPFRPPPSPYPNQLVPRLPRQDLTTFASPRSTGPSLQLSIPTSATSPTSHIPASTTSGSFPPLSARPAVTHSCPQDRVRQCARAGPNAE